MLATGEADWDEADENDQDIKELYCIVLFDLVAPHDDGHLEQSLGARLKDGFQNFEFHGTHNTLLILIFSLLLTAEAAQSD